MTTALADDVTTNAEQRLFVIPCGKGFSCLGFDVCFEWSKGVAAWLESRRVHCPAPDPAIIGTPAAYLEHSAIMSAGREECDRTGVKCPALLTRQLIGLEGKRVEVIDCYGETRRFIVGKSTGWLPIHLEIAERSNRGGGGVTGTPFQYVRMVPVR